MHHRITSCVVLLGALGATLGGADQLEQELERQLRGAWSVLRVEAFSDCTGSYTNNRVGSGGVASTGDRRFAPGETVKVDKLDLKSSRLDLLCSVAEPVLVSWSDGPFQLYGERECKVELMVELPRELVRSDDAAGVLAVVDQVVERHQSLEAAQRSELWNQREHEPFPDDYEETMARYQVWKAEQTNAAVAARVERAQVEANRVVAGIRREPGYLDGLAAGVEAMRYWSENDCEDLVRAEASGELDSPPSEKSKDRGWCDGFRDGQELSFSLQLAERLARCYLPVPSLAGVAP